MRLTFTRECLTALFLSVKDPGSGAFMTPGSGIRIRDPGSGSGIRDQDLGSGMGKKSDPDCGFGAFFTPGSGMGKNLDPGWGKIWIRDENPR
jgi:hypothetical protein